MKELKWFEIYCLQPSSSNNNSDLMIRNTMDLEILGSMNKSSIRPLSK